MSRGRRGKMRDILKEYISPISIKKNLLVSNKKLTVNGCVIRNIWTGETEKVISVDNDPEYPLTTENDDDTFFRNIYELGENWEFINGVKFKK